MSDLVVYQHKNLKQNEFHDIVLKCVAGLLPYRYLFYGGAIRGGKTFVCLFIFWTLAKLFPGSRWYVIREDNPALESTSIPSMEKLIGKEGDNFAWRRSKGDTQVVLNNGSRIFFKSENIQRDPELKEFLGMEMNGCLLEQMEALSEKTFARVMERLGSWYIDPMPIPLLLGTFNPSPTWVKTLIYDKFIKGQLTAPFYYQPALPNDNPFVTNEQWANWANLDPESQKVMIKGIWSFKASGNVWAYSFEYDKHVISKHDKTMQLNIALPLHLIFDFNVDPMTCLVAQRDGMLRGRIIGEIRIRNSDIFEMCERIKTTYPGYYYVVTGDASGRNRTGVNRGNKSYVDIIKNELGLKDLQVQFPKSNPSVSNTRIIVNSILYKHPDFKISDACLYLIDDCATVKTDENGDIDKKHIDKTKTHLLDNLRYFIWNYFRNFVNIKF